MLINKQQKIFVAGHKGMAGSAIIRTLRRKKYTNIVTVDKSDLDLTQFKEVESWFEINNPDIVILCAAKVGGILANNTYPTEYLLENLKIQNNVIENSWKFGVKRLLFLGSSCIYPKYANQPIKEEYLLSGILEKTNEAYALAKIAGIKLCQALRRQYSFDAISIMPTNLYGPGDNFHSHDSHVLPALIRKFCDAKEKNLPCVTCWGTGNVMREFLHVDDLGDAAIFCLEKWDVNSKNAPKDSSNEPLTHLNVGTGKDITIKDLVKLIAYATKYNGEIIWDHEKPDGTPKKQLNTEKITQLGWKPTIDLKNGIIRTVEYFKENRDQLRL